ncbi:MAG: tRNA 2-thiouridine(34) synthase MnmA [Rhodospirillaceae bacterium]|jgi:tRNA-uridine 2-sulfurtransferase|nr:tRNA 2-thiouridine(34) synthase MnmA [Rhodospirillaceae bacterium]MBT5566637.1 tRNA 2-thiouridine(34) synthase MnmA [Rhodospirillaceae bacterium]MBT6087997.1 tRNA 2-thiouridine(34) synthase MnmA [Rhodospirillaceae bacterium]MBT7450163.1 tRNA 2-thiouridine(34) synthase MnmA [Rhodospirillaceae bacterium]
MTSVQKPTSGSKPRIAVAMSGGVDSSVCAALLVEQGYDVIGLTMQLYDHGAATSKSKTCCAGQDIHDAKRVADKVGIPHYVLDYEKRFEKDVIIPFAESYQRGETPIPCILCNQTVKFRDLIDAARDFGAEALATGHYIRRAEDEEAVSLHRAVDQSKDQSYFLFATTPEQLAFVRFPLGEISKAETRVLAEKFDLDIADKADSQDICFVPTGSYTNIVDKFGSGAASQGRFVHVDGHDMGEHNGIENYTVGQRRGLGLGGEAEPLYVIEIRLADHEVVVGPRADLAKHEIEVRDVNWLGAPGGVPETEMRIQARVRNTHEPVSALISQGAGAGQAKVSFDEPLYGVSPGQACVFYDGDQVLGGGWIMAGGTNMTVPHNKRNEGVAGLQA